MAKITLTDRTIQALTPPDRGQAMFFDTKTPNFGVRVSQGGTKTFVAVVGKRRQYRTLGRYPAVSLKAARREAQALNLAQTPRSLEKPVVRHFEAAESFLADCRRRLKLRTVSDYERLLRHFPFPGQLSNITSYDIKAKLDAIAAPSERHHAYVALRTYLNWCIKHGFITSSPLTIAPTTPDKPRERVLTPGELKVIYQHATTYPFGTLLRLLIHTGLRRSEAAHLHQSWITDTTLTIPASHTKNGRPHTLPLTPQVQTLLDGLPSQMFSTRNGNVFTNWGNSKKAFDTTLSVDPWRIHDLRRTFASLHAEIGTPIHVTEKLLNHVSGSFGGVHGIYNRYDYQAEMAAALHQYEKRLESILA